VGYPRPVDERVEARSGGGRGLLTAASLVVVGAGLKAIQSLAIPFLISVLLAILCTPVVSWLRRRRLPAAIAVPLVVVVLLGVFFAFGAVLGGSVKGFADAVPRYQERLDSLGNSVEGWLEERGVTVGELEVGKVLRPGALLDLLGKGLVGLLSALSNTLLVILTLLFILLEAAGLPVKLRAAFGDRPGAGLGRLAKATREVQKYLGIKTAISAATGAILAAWLAVLGLDFALTWGFLAFLLNFIPSIGSIIAAVPAVLLALVQVGPGTAALVAIGFVVVNMTLGNIVEPHLMGRTLGMSTLAVFLSLLFWGFLWGPVGMFLSVPLTMVMKIGLENSRDLRWVAVLLDSPRAAEARLVEEPAAPVS